MNRPKFRQVLDCGGPPSLWGGAPPVEKWQRAAAAQEATVPASFPAPMRPMVGGQCHSGAGRRVIGLIINGQMTTVKQCPVRNSLRQSLIAPKAAAEKCRRYF